MTTPPAASGAVESQESSSTWNLLALTPGYLAPEHGPYVAALTKALANAEIKNIALSGNYGVGKSSILKRLSELENGRVVELSLSTLAPIEASTLDGSVPVQATTPTNRIQQEIVKQLLYREDPNRAPGSRFRRIERFEWKRELALAGIVGLAVTVIFLLAGWGATITATLKPLVDLVIWVYPLILVLATGATFGVRFLLHGRVHIKAFSAGPAAVTLDEKSVSYFDQYLDEIVYFFETSPYDIVVFEDIDRFNDSHIFETLRSLNTLLNAAPEIDRSGRTIRFVYAIKDSIFDRIGLESEGRKDVALEDITDPAQAESVRANRTKFFDLVVPVVPFITHRSARNLASKLLDGLEHTVSPDLVDRAGRFVPDMRLLKNVRNEFVVFRDRIFSGDGKELDLSETDLFAMMLYKSTHLSDFETIRLGSSKLDKLYAAHRKLVSTNIRRVEREIRATRSALTRAGKSAERSERLGSSLLAHIARTARAAGYQEHSPQYALGSTTRSAADLKQPAFWLELASSKGAALTWRNGYYNQTMSFTRADLAEALGDPIDAAAWEQADKDALNDTLATLLEQLTFLRSADMGGVMKRPEFLVKYEEEEQSLAAVAEKLLTRGLAFELIREGYINKNFTLYTSTFHGDRVGPAATNFIIHHVEQNLMDVDFQLSGEDVDAVVRERGTAALGEPALYNIAILDRLLQTDVETADIMVTSVARLGDSARDFLQAYLNAGQERARFLGRLVRKSTRVLPYLVSEAELDDATRLQLVSDALANLAHGTKYSTDDATARYLADHYTSLPALTKDAVDPKTAASIAILFLMAGIKIVDLSALTEAVRRAFVSRNGYVISKSNLLAALGKDADLALDSIHALDEKVYEYLLDNLEDYLKAVEGHSTTVESSDGFVAIIEDVLEHDADHLEDIIAGASKESRVLNLADAPESSWPLLARYGHVPATFGNIITYLGEGDSIDADLSELLKEARAITAVDNAAEADKVRLALAVLAASTHIHSTIRVPLVVSLKLSEALDATAIAPSNSMLFPLLLESHLIADDAGTYEHLGRVDWKWREELIRVSRQFKSFMTPELVGEDLASLLTSTSIGKAIKLKTLDEAADYASASDASGRGQLARFAVANGRGLPLDVVVQLPADRADTATALALLGPHLEVVDDSRLFTMLHAIGGAYAQLTHVGHDRPTIPDTAANRALLKSLEQRGIVTKADIEGASLRVSKRHK